MCTLCTDKRIKPTSFLIQKQEQNKDKRTITFISYDNHMQNYLLSSNEPILFYNNNW